MIIQKLINSKELNHGVKTLIIHDGNYNKIVETLSDWDGFAFSKIPHFYEKIRDIT